MQAFSYLQRKIYDKDHIALSLIWLGLFVWGAIAKAHPYMPPLFGVLLAGALVIKGREYTIGVFAYLLFYEADRGYFLFSTWAYYYFHTRYLMPLIASFMDCKKCLMVLSVILGYAIYFAFIFLAGSLLFEKVHYYNIVPLLVYIAVESIIVLMVDDVSR